MRNSRRLARYKAHGFFLATRRHWDALTKHAGSINYKSRMERTWEDKIILLLRIGLNNLYKVSNAYCKGNPIWWNGGVTDWRNVIAEYKEYSKIRNIRKILEYGIYRIF